MYKYIEVDGEHIKSVFETYAEFIDRSSKYKDITGKDVPKDFFTSPGWRYIDDEIIPPPPKTEHEKLLLELGMVDAKLQSLFNVETHNANFNAWLGDGTITQIEMARDTNLESKDELIAQRNKILKKISELSDA